MLSLVLTLDLKQKDSIFVQKSFTLELLCKWMVSEMKIRNRLNYEHMWPQSGSIRLSELNHNLYIYFFEAKTEQSGEASSWSLSWQLSAQLGCLKANEAKSPTRITEVMSVFLSNVRVVIYCSVLWLIVYWNVKQYD